MKIYLECTLDESRDGKEPITREKLEKLEHALTELACHQGLPVTHTTARHSAPPRGALAPLRVGLIYNLKRVDPRSGDDRDAEFDAPTTVQAIHDAIASRGHEVVRIEALPTMLDALPEADIDLAFNIAEGVGGRAREAQVPAVLELLDIEYTGSDASTMCMTLDKALAKRLVAQAGVPTAPFMLLRTGQETPPPSLTFPVVVKPNAEGSSKGITGTSVAYGLNQLRTIAAQMIRQYPRSAALAESFLSGREFTVGLLEDASGGVIAMPPMEIVFSEAAGEHPIYSYAHKMDTDKSASYQVPAQVDEALGARIMQVARDSFTALGCRDVARIDIRLDDAGEPNFIECNPLPGLTPDWSDLCMIAKGSGIDYNGLIERIMAPAIARYRAHPRHTRTHL